MKYFKLSFLFIFFIQTYSFTQIKKVPLNDGVVSGRIIDKVTSKAIDYVSVKMYSVKDSAVFTGAYTDSEGKFILENIPFGSYYLKYIFSGYQTKMIEDVFITSDLKTINLGVIKLEQDATQELQEVKVVGNLEVLKTGIDKKIYNVGEDLSVKGGTANDILNNLPSVEVDQEGRVTLRGDAQVTILIDGRPSSLSGGNGKTLLDALPAGSIERIEIVTNPSSKYDPDGTSGIINIVLKKNKLKGFNGLLNLNVGSGDLTGGNLADGSFSLSYRNSKLNTYGSYSGRFMEGFRNHYSNVTQDLGGGKQFILNQERFGTDLNSGSTFRVGGDFYLKNRNTLGVSVTGNIGQRDREGNQWNKTKNENDSITALWNRISYDPTNNKNLDINLNYKYEFKNQRGDFILDANQSIGNEAISGFYEQYNYNPDTLLIGEVIQQRLFNKEKNNVSSVQADLVYTYPKVSARMEVGTKAIIRGQKVSPYSESYNSLLDMYMEDSLANFNYQYTEQVFSLYGLYGQELKKFKYQVGLRIEESFQIPNLISDSIRIVNEYLNFFPSAHLRYAIKDKMELSLSYSRRINRANSSNLNPFTNYSDPYNLQRGNPYLQPEFIDSYDLSYSIEKKKLNVTASLFYRYTTDVITRIKVFYPDNTAAVTFANLDVSNSVGTELVFVYRPTTWWRNTVSGNFNFTEFSDQNLTYYPNRNGYNWNLKYAGTFDFWKRTASIQINANYNAPRITIQGTAQRRGAVDISGEKKFKDGNIKVGFRVSDIFNRQGFYITIDQPGIYQEAEFKWLTRKFFLTFVYKFGKLEISNKKSGTGGDGGFEM